MDSPDKPHGQTVPPSSQLIQPEVVPTSPAGPAAHPTPIVIHQSGGMLTRLAAWFGWLGLLVCIPVILALFASFYEYFDTTGGVLEKYHSMARYGRDKIAIIQVEGLLLEGEGFVKRQIERVRRDKRVKAIVVRIDSPGGTVTASDFIYHHLQKLQQKKDIPMVVSMGSMAASGGYYVAMAVGDRKRSIFAEPTTTTGSIGVIIPHYDLSGLLARYDVKDDSIASHPRKQLLSMTKEMSPENREILQRYVDESFQRFKKIVRNGRPQLRDDPEALDRLATGEIFSAQQAKSHGLIDQIGFVEDAVERAVELAKLTKDEVRVVKYRRAPSLLDAFSTSGARTGTLQSLVMDLAVPRAYYLSTSLPALVRPQIR